MHVRHPVRCQIGGEKRSAPYSCIAIPTMNAHSSSRTCACAANLSSPLFRRRTRMLEVTSAGNAADGLGPAHVQNTIQICICACLPNTQKSITRFVRYVVQTSDGHQTKMFDQSKRRRVDRELLSFMRPILVACRRVVKGK